MLTSEELNDFLNTANQNLESLNPKDLQLKLEDLQHKLQQPEVWDNSELATQLNKKFSHLHQKITNINQFYQKLDDLKAAFDLQDELEFAALLKACKEELQKQQQQIFLNGLFDRQGALLSIHAGAGGVDAQDWAAMLTSMYQAFCKNQNWSCKLISISVGEEGGVKSAFLEIEGEFAYGLLKEEMGVHRLVRISPFNAGKTRETSFASVEILPNNLEENVKVPDFKEDEVRWDYFMASGKGGQSVNTTYSAVRLTHLDTKISVTCQNERSQQQNKQMAIKYLKNKLAALEIQKQENLRKELKGDFLSIQWGSQIRSYVLHPYKLIKDHRSGHEVDQIDTVLENGQILPFIWAMKQKST